jgi:serine/threonine protein kinase
VTSLIGQTIGKCRIEKLLGTGGMGEVYRGRHIHLDRPQAIKVMHEQMALDSTFQERFRQEAHSVALLDHANIVKLYDYGEQDGRYYITMELLEDGSLRALLDRRARENQIWPLAFGLTLIRQAAEALAFAHSRGIIHRDIKPDNLLLLRQRAPDGRSNYTIKVSDFGLAQMAESSGLTSMGKTVGTPAYMSPEQCQGLPLDGRSDIYSLGVVLYEVMTGYLPFNTTTPSDAIKKHVFTPVPPPRSVRPDLPREIEAAILRCLAKEPPQRYESAADLAVALRDLARLFTNSPTPTPPPTPPPEPNARHVQVIDAQGQLVQAVDLIDTQITVGRLPDNDIVLNDAVVSRKHLRVEWNGQRVKVYDLGTKSGTRIDGTVMQANAPQNWQIGQPIQIGSFTLRLALGAAGIVSVTLPPEAQQLSLTPGTQVDLPVAIRNRGSSAETYAIVVDEWPAAWIAVPVQPVTVPPGSQGTTTLALRVPPGALRDAASYRVMVRAIGLGQPDSTDVTSATWSVSAPARARVAVRIEPERAQGRDQASFTVRVENDGQLPADVVLSAHDERQQLVYSLPQTRMTLAPGEATDVALTVRTTSSRVFGGAVTHTFVVSASVIGSETFTATGLFVQTSLLPI